jgi:hypothetical protein
MKTFGHFCLLFFFAIQGAFSLVAEPSFPKEGIVGPDNAGKIDPGVDYERFSGRLTDKDDSGRVLKIKVENNNSKFFRSGDLVLFTINLKDKRSPCKAFVRAVEDFYFTVYVETLNTCLKSSEYLRRGSVLNFYSKALAVRVFEASKYREQLIQRKEDFLKQLNETNHFLWTFDQQKVKTAASYDEKLIELQKEKRRALDDMISQKQERLVLQNELMNKLRELDDSLQFYRVERQELMTDRWQLDHDLGLPFGQRPQEVKQH